MSNPIQINTVTVQGLTAKCERNSERLKWADGSKYALDFYIDGVSDEGQSYSAEVTVILQTWTDNKDGQFVLTTDVSIERFSKAHAQLPTPEGRGYGWKYSDLTEEQIEAEEAAQEKADWAIGVYLNRINYDRNLYAVRDQIKEAAHKAFFNLR